MAKLFDAISIQSAYFVSIPYFQILSGMYPISQVQEPYTAVGYLAARVPLVDLLQLVHPLNRADSDDEEGGVGDENHPWSAWDVCDGKMNPKSPSMRVFAAIVSSCLLMVLNNMETFFFRFSLGP